MLLKIHIEKVDFKTSLRYNSVVRKDLSCLVSFKLIDHQLKVIFGNSEPHNK